jgi:hypothetical protein
VQESDPAQELHEFGPGQLLEDNVALVVIFQSQNLLARWVCTLYCNWLDRCIFEHFQSVFQAKLVRFYVFGPLHHRSMRVFVVQVFHQFRISLQHTVQFLLK